MLVSLVLITTLSPAVAEDRLTESIREHRRDLSLVGGSPEGDGFEWLVEQGADARFVLLGEAHGNAETPAITTALADRLADEGFSALALEIGPVAAHRVSTLASEVDAEEQLADLTRDVPFGIAFFNYRDEIDLVCEASRRGYEIWGLDQEFVGSVRLHLPRLLELAGDDDTRAVVADLLEKEQQVFQRFLTSGDQTGAMLDQGEEAFAPLRTAFAGDPEGAWIVDELAASARVYGHYHAGRYFENNRDRIALMKEHFASRLRDSDARVILKFGAAHMGRGLSPFHQYDLGNFAPEVAALTGDRSFHVMIMGEKIVRSEGESSVLAGNLALAELVDASPTGKGAVFDLVALRPLLSARSVQERHPDLFTLAFRFDALVMLPELTEAESLVSPPRSG